MTSNTNVSVKIIDPDGTFIVLEVTNESIYVSEIFLDKQALRFTSKETKWVILCKEMSSANFVSAQDDTSNITLEIAISEREPARLTVKTIGVMKSYNDQEELKKFFESIGVQVNQE